jgi:hypothetical protein
MMLFEHKPLSPQENNVICHTAPPTPKSWHPAAPHTLLLAYPFVPLSFLFLLFYASSSSHGKQLTNSQGKKSLASLSGALISILNLGFVE